MAGTREPLAVAPLPQITTSYSVGIVLPRWTTKDSSQFPDSGRLLFGDPATRRLLAALGITAK